MGAARFDCVSTASSRYETPRRWRELRLGWKSDSTEEDRRLLRLAGSDGAAEDLIDEPAPEEKKPVAKSGSKPASFNRSATSLLFASTISSRKSSYAGVNLAAAISHGSA